MPVGHPPADRTQLLLPVTNRQSPRCIYRTGAMSFACGAAKTTFQIAECTYVCTGMPLPERAPHCYIGFRQKLENLAREMIRCPAGGGDGGVQFAAVGGMGKQQVARQVWRCTAAGEARSRARVKLHARFGDARPARRDLEPAYQCRMRACGAVRGGTNHRIELKMVPHDILCTRNR